MQAPVGADPVHLIHLDRTEWFPHSPQHVWSWMSRTELFQQWWRWLREFETDGGGLTGGGAFHGLVVPPIPYRFRVGIHFDEVRPAERIIARLSGDLNGPADCALRPARGGCELTIRWHVEMRKPAMRAAARYAKGLLVWGHDQVIETTLSRFKDVIERA